MTKNITKIDGLLRFENDGIEIFIDPQGKSFASINGVARMAGRNESTIRKFLLTRQIHVINVEIDTGYGKKLHALLSSGSICKVLAQYNKDRLIQFAEVGVETALHQIAGYEQLKAKPFISNESRLTLHYEGGEIDAIIPHDRLWELIQIAKSRKEERSLIPEFFEGIPECCLKIPLAMLEYVRDSLIAQNAYLGYAEGERQATIERRKMLTEKQLKLESKKMPIEESNLKKLR
jgi:hypothetical protein